MDGEKLLSEHLRDWAARNDVTLHWVKGTLRLETPNGDAGAVVSIPKGFWTLYEQCDTAQQETARDSILLSVDLQYRPPASAFAHDIEIPLNLVEKSA